MRGIVRLLFIYGWYLVSMSMNVYFIFFIVFFLRRVIVIIIVVIR